MRKQLKWMLYNDIRDRAITRIVAGKPTYSGRPRFYPRYGRCKAGDYRQAVLCDTSIEACFKYLRFLRFSDEVSECPVEVTYDDNGDVLDVVRAPMSQSKLEQLYDERGYKR